MSDVTGQEGPGSQEGLAILWILPYLPWPTTSGGKLRQFHLLKKMTEKGHRITLVVQSKTAVDAATRRVLETVAARLIVLERRPLRHPVTLLAAAFAPYPLLVSVNGLAPQLEHLFAELMQHAWDVIQIAHSYTLQPYLGYLQRTHTPFLLCEHNIESSLGAATYQNMPGWLAPYILYDQWRYRRWERQAYRAAKRLVAVTSDDARKMAVVRGSEVDVVINGVDAGAFAEVSPDVSSLRILFVGNFEYPPNQDAVIWCVEAIMPMVWQKQPAARLVICGFAMPAHWQKRWPDVRIEWRGYVEDLRIEQQKAAIFVAPLREGGGSKLKVLEALAAGLPLVSTRQGVSGLALTDEQFVPGDTTEELAEGLLRVLADTNLARHLGESGRQFVAGSHDWSVSANQLNEVYRKMCDANRT